LSSSSAIQRGGLLKALVMSAASTLLRHVCLHAISHAS
jgi:hypothetical protein